MNIEAQISENSAKFWVGGTEKNPPSYVEDHIPHIEGTVLLWRMQQVCRVTSSKIDIKQNEAVYSFEYHLSPAGATLVCRSVRPSSHPNWKQKFLWLGTLHSVTIYQVQLDKGHPPKVSLLGCAWMLWGICLLCKY